MHLGNSTSKLRRLFLRRRGAVTGIALLASMAAGVFIASKPPQRTAKHRWESATRSSDGDVSNALSSLLEYRFEVGNVYRYTISQTLGVERQGAAVAAVNGNGTLNAHAIRVEKGFIDLIVDIAFDGSAGLSAMSKGTHSTRKAMKIGTSAALRVSTKGRVQSLRFLANESPSDISLFTTILSTWLYTLPGADPAKERVDDNTFRVEATDASGDFAARYELPRSAAAPFELTMKKERYGRASLLTRVITSNHRLRFNVEDGYLLHAKSDDVYGKGARSMEVQSHEQNELAFERVERSLLNAHDLARYTLSAPIYSPVPTTARAERTLADGTVRSWTELRKQLSTMSRDPQSEQPMDLFSSLLASLDRDPTMLDSVLAEADRYATSSTQFKMMVGAVGTLGTPAAQQGLVDLYARTDKTGKDLVLKSQALMERASTPETREMLLRTEQDKATPSDLKSTAGLAMGAVLRNRDGEDGSVTATRERIVTMWNQAVLPSDKQYALRVIGNSGDPYFIDLLSSEIQNPASPFRAPCVEALRFMNDDRAAALLSWSLAGDDVSLQRAAANAIAFQGYRPEYVEPLNACVLASPAVELRIVCARTALQQPAHQQQMLALLQRVRAQDGVDERLRAFIDSQAL